MDNTRLTLDLSSVLKNKKIEPIVQFENYSEDESLIQAFDKPADVKPISQEKDLTEEVTSPVVEPDESFDHE